MRIGKKKGQRTTHENTIDDDTSSPLVGARAFSSSFIVSTTTMPLLFAVLFVGRLVFASPLYSRVLLGKFAVLYLCLKMMSMTIYTQKGKRRSRPLFFFFFFLEKVAFRSRGRPSRGRGVVASKKSRFFSRLWRTKGFFFTGFCREVLCPLYAFCFKKKCVKKNVSKKMSRVFVPFCLKKIPHSIVLSTHGSSSR